MHEATPNHQSVGSPVQHLYFSSHGVGTDTCYFYLAVSDTVKVFQLKIVYCRKCVHIFLGQSGTLPLCGLKEFEYAN